MRSWCPYSRSNASKTDNSSVYFQANKHDETHDEHGIYVFKNMWLLLLENKAQLSALQPLAGNVTNLSAVTLHHRKVQYELYLELLDWAVVFTRQTIV